jgi:hypothetical protein
MKSGPRGVWVTVVLVCASPGSATVKPPSTEVNSPHSLFEASCARAHAQSSRIRAKDFRDFIAHSPPSVRFF